MKKILITGGAGFIGNYIVAILSGNKDYEITILDNFSKQIHGEDHTQSFLYRGVRDKATIIQGDVRNHEDIERALDGVDTVIHLAAETGTGQSMYEISRYTDVNLGGTSNLLDVIVNKKLPVKKIILASSRSVYGEGMYHCPIHGTIVPSFRETEDMANGVFYNKCPLCEGEVTLMSTTEDSPVKPISYYAYTKYAQEKMLETMCPVLGIDFTIFRFQNVYGAGQSLNNPYTGILSIFSKLFLANRPVNIFEDGLESRDFVHVSDVARATCAAISNPKTNGAIINVGTGENISVIDVANTMKKLYRSESTITISGDFRKGDIRHNKADISKMVELCGVEPIYDFERGMTEFTAWVKEELKDDLESLSEKAYLKSLDEMKETGILVTSEARNETVK